MNLDNTIVKICTKEYDHFIGDSNIIGIAKGKKIKNGIKTNNPCITVFVEKKLPSEIIRKDKLIPSFYKGINTDVVETGKVSSLSLTNKIRPAIGGYSAGVIGITAGTIACAARSLDADSTEYYLLSNNHTFANENLARLGSPILQPSPYDGGSTENDIIGYLYDYEPISFITKNRFPKNYVDCALAICDFNDISDNIALIGQVAGIAKPRVGMHVKKTGRTTAITTGKILYTNASMVVSYEGGDALFVNQIITTSMSQGGDSGSLLLNNSNKAIGLLFAGSPSFSICNPISAILKTLNIELL